MKEIVLLFLFFSIFFCVQAQKNNLKYNITASLNDRDNSINGFLELNYTNNTSDTLHYLWFNIYPNAFKSDRTAFSEYLLSKGKTDFYFADQQKRGYINRLDFRSGENILKTEDHPLYLDIIKVLLDKPLVPKGALVITTPFHVKLPYNFDGIGYKYPQYNLRYWYPAVAEFIRPLTNADSSSNETGDYNVRITLKNKLGVTSPYLNADHSSSSDSLKTVNLVASGVKDISVIIVKPHTVKPVSKKGVDSLYLSQKIGKILAHSILPAAGYNIYDGFQLGILSHNLHKNEKFSYYIAPVYAFRSKSVAGIAGASYRVNTEKYAEEVEAGFTASAFSYDDGVDTNSNKVFAKLFKVVPFVRVKLPTRSPAIEKSFTFKSYIINEKDLEFVKYSVDSLFYPSEGKFATRFVNELTFDYSSNRVLYPYHARIQVQQGLTFYRLNATGNYFFNYPKGGGMNLRVFAAKFGYIGSLNSNEKFAATRYQPKLTAVRGEEDYTYSNYFIGRNSFDGFTSNQIMMRDGGLKLRTDLFEGLQGRSENWVASLNLNTSIPKIFPVNIPLKIFFDAGTYAEAWDTDNPNPRFLYVAGLQLSLFRGLINIYAPVLYSKQFRDQLKSVPEENTFVKKLSFSIDIQRFTARSFFNK